MKLFKFAALFVIMLSSCATSYNSSSVSRSTALDILQKTDYIINEAYEITDYFYYNDGEYVSRSIYFQDYAYELYDSRFFDEAINYSLRAREYAIYAIELCDDYWEYYDYTYYGASRLYGRNPNFNIAIRNSSQLHWSIRYAAAHNYRRVNWNLYFTDNEWAFYNAMPIESAMLGTFYNARGRVVFNDRFSNPGIYSKMRSRIYTGRDKFYKKYPNMANNMIPLPANIQPRGAQRPSTTGARRMPSVETTRPTVNYQQSTATSSRSGGRTSSSRTSSNSNNAQSQPLDSRNQQQSGSTTSRRSSSGSSRSTVPPVDNQSNKAQERQAKQENINIISTGSGSSRTSTTSSRSSSSTRSNSSSSTRSSSSSSSTSRGSSSRSSSSSSTSGSSSTRSSGSGSSSSRSGGRR